MGDERLPAGDHRLRRHRRPARRHVRPQARLPRRHGRSSPLGSVVSGAAQATGDADRRPRPAGDRRGADAAALAGDRLQRLPGRRAGAGARHLGGGLGARAGDRAARRRRPGRARLAGDLLDQPAGRRGRRSRSPLAAAPESTDPGAGTRIDFAGPAGAQRRPHRGRPGAGPGAGLERRAGDRRSALGGVARALRLLADRAPRRASRSSTSPSSATGPTSAPAPPPSPWSAPTGR